MSKKHPQQNSISGSQNNASLSHEAEYKIIKFDLVKVVILNAVYLGAILVLYFANQKSHVVDNWFAKIFHF